MARECEHCGVTSSDDSETCELCGAALPKGAGVETYPHRIPTGVGVDRSVASPPTMQPSHHAMSPALRAQLAAVEPLESPAAEEPRRHAARGAEAHVEHEPSAHGDHTEPDGADANETIPHEDPLAFDTVAGDEPHTQDWVGERAADVAAAASYTGEHRTPSGQTPAVGAESIRGRVMLRVEQGQIIGERYLLTEASTIIGRADPESAHYPDIDLSGQDNDYVHRHHARLTFYDVDTRLSVEHIGGHNVTLVNNEPVEAGELVELCVGDRLRVGRVVMRMERAPH